MTDTEDELIRTGDFQSIQLQVTIANTTTGAELPAEPPCKVVQLMERGMVLEVPSRSCSKGHNLMVSLQAHGLKENLKFSCTGKVEETESILGPTEQITIGFLQFPEKEWKALMAGLNSRQEDILNFFNAAKGR